VPGRRCRGASRRFITRIVPAGPFSDRSVRPAAEASEPLSSRRHYVWVLDELAALTSKQARTMSRAGAHEPTGYRVHCAELTQRPSRRPVAARPSRPPTTGRTVSAIDALFAAGCSREWSDRAGPLPRPTSPPPRARTPRRVERSGRSPNGSPTRKTGVGVTTPTPSPRSYAGAMRSRRCWESCSSGPREPLTRAFSFRRVSEGGL
jgi:hypothetical protein